MHEAVPGARRIGGLFVLGAPYRNQSEREMRNAADNLGVELLSFDAAEPKHYSQVFEAMRAAGVQGVAIMANPILFRDRDALMKLALKAGLPTVCEWSEMAHAGCLLGYGPSAQELRRRLAGYWSPAQVAASISPRLFSSITVAASSPLWSMCVVTWRRNLSRVTFN